MITYKIKGFPAGHNLPLMYNLSGFALLKNAGVLLPLAFLKASICFLLRSTISRGRSWYILKLVSRSRYPKESSFSQSLYLKNLARIGRGLSSLFFPRRCTLCISMLAASLKPSSVSRKLRSKDSVGFFV